MEEQVGRCDDDGLRARARANARLALEGGVTTLRDLGDRGYVTLDLRDDPDLPTILASGPPLTIVQGHCWYLGGECADGDALVAGVRERHERGCDVIKIMATGGAGTPTVPGWVSQFAPDDLRRAVAEAHRLRMPVAAHCHGDDGIAQAVDAGVDTIEHCTFINPELDPDPDPAAAYAERARLFALPRSSWADYDASLLSTGGGVYARSAKSIPLSPAVRARLEHKRLLLEARAVLREVYPSFVVAAVVAVVIAKLTVGLLPHGFKW